MHQKMKVAIIGCGMICDVYFKNLSEFYGVELIGCSDIRDERAKEKAEVYGVRHMTNEEIFADPSIEMVVNLTYPTSHYEVAKAALLAGKHVYTEKMMVGTLEQANELVALAEEKGLFCGGAPDTYLGASVQLARQLLDSGIIGTPTMAEVFLSRDYRHERWNTSPYKRFAFCPYGGIPFDMGAYYLTVLVFLLGRVERVCGMADIREPHRTFRHPDSPLYGQEMLGESYNRAAGTLQFENGVMGSFVMTSEGGAGRDSFVIHGTDGYIDLGDPNCYNKTVTIKNKEGQESVIASPFAFGGKDFRGIGVLEAAYALSRGETPRCNGHLCRHVLETALGICENDGALYEMTTDSGRPAPLPVGFTENFELLFQP